MNHPRRDKQALWLKEAGKMQDRCRLLFLSNPNGRAVLWHILVEQCGIFERCLSDESRIRHNIGIELMNMCGMLYEGRPKDQIFAEIAKLKPEKKTLMQRIRRK
jgi:hypothetical protein